MNPEEIARIDRVTEAIHYLLKGQTPPPIPCEDDPKDEIRQLSGKVNTLIHQFGEIKGFIDPLSEGRLDIALPKGNFLASPFKQLHAALNHLTWQTQRVAEGDFEQRVDFMGDFSRAFNSMIEALAETRTQLLAEADRYKKLAELKNYYLNVMAHDIRTPIGAILGFADILLDGEADGKSRKHIEIIRRNCDNLLSLINNILDMAKIEKQGIEIMSVPFNIRALGTDIGELMESRLADGVRFHFRPDPAVPDYVMGDPQRLKQVLDNLVGNAVKFTREGTIELSIRSRKGGDNGPHLDFSVSDTGIGIPSDQLTRIFDPFVQVEGGIQCRFGGTGLGLAIARELTALMGGDLIVESRVGKGTRFRFGLPFSPASRSDAGAETNAKENACRPGSCRILVVDDDQDSLHIIARRLKQQGVRYTLCQESTEAIGKLADAWDRGDPFTLAWLDIDMPGLDGFELAARIREDPRFVHLGLAACTSYVERMDDPDKANLFSFVASKPVSDPALKRILSEAGGGFEVDHRSFDLTGRRVLVVDDNPVNRFLLKNLLQKLSVTVDEAQDGEQGLRKIEADDYDAVVMDKMMPVMDGLEAIRRIRRLPDRRRVPILAFTAEERAEENQEMLQAGANAVLPKILDAETLAERLYRVIRGIGDV